ncbi:c-type cytochrome [Spongiibacter taiwanensis]|uniref:c-type cytochrome n=1 Tax=Spongiibacter taiwanensis TaxID=1748242 RepID=UPI002034CD52|nr:c-type cytochrome [Spongiibacter taiwanensis]USA44762.1 c-type cytochrome [Spongiibacter taiwanensis]
MKKVLLKQVASAVALLVLALSAWALTDKQRDEVSSRIAPAGKVCLQGDSGCGAAMAASGGGAKSGKEVYEGSCQGCHATGAGNAPKMGDTAAWAPRIAQGNDTLYTHAIEGLNNVGMMPAKGLCMTCSDDEIKAAVDYMVENSQ